jgi:ADP-heptose:LPS heptosyltransferase
VHLTGLPLNRLAAVLERCSVHLGADSGVLHLAVALGIPTISMFRRYPGLREWAPIGNNHQVLVSTCDCSSKNNFSPCETAGYSACLAKITPDQVFNRISEMI